MRITPMLAYGLAILLTACNQADKKTPTATVLSLPAPRFINPPINGVNVPYKEYAIDAQKGDTIFNESGSTLVFPPNAFVDASGKVISGPVQVTFREFYDPVDFYLAGIPMKYDSAGVQYTFESAGMCEVLAYQDGKPVHVNPNNKPVVAMPTNNARNVNTYFLDTVQKRWVYKEISVPMNLLKKQETGWTKRGATIDDGSTAPVSNNVSAADYEAIPAPTEPEIAEVPVTPLKANNNSPVLKLVVDPASFKELTYYDNLQFQLDVNETRFSPADAQEEWNAVDIKRTGTSGLYTLTFSNANKKVTYQARPVFEGAAYDEAVKKFDAYNATHKRKLKKEVIAARKKYIKDSVKAEQVNEFNTRLEKINQLVSARNLQLDRKNQAAMIRCFELGDFGVWNCDQPLLLEGYTVYVSFKDKEGNFLDLHNTAIAYKKYNAIYPCGNRSIRLLKDSRSMIVGTYLGRFAYITYEEFQQLSITSSTTEQTFIMTVVSDKNNNYNYIKSVIRPK